MKIYAIIGIFVLLFSVIALSLADNADAARMGGGRSFGGRPSMSQPASPPAGVQQRAGQPGAAAPTASKPGFFGGMGGGLLGGLLAGTLLGSLLGGGGAGGGGFLDIILLAILAFIGYKLFMRFRARQSAEPAAAGSPSMRQDTGWQSNNPFTKNPSVSGQSGWDALSSGQSQAYPQSNQPNVDIPADFDANEFLQGAKAVYNKLQAAWDRRDINEISQFATPAVVSELKKQMAEDPNPSHTEIMLVNAKLVGVEDEGENRRAQVYFDVLMREYQNQQTPNSAREIWHFLRIGKNGNWKLDGIQQVE